MPKVAVHPGVQGSSRAARGRERAPDESRSAACERLTPKIGVKPVTLYGWVKKALPKPTAPVLPGSSEELRAQVAALRKES